MLRENFLFKYWRVQVKADVITEDSSLALIQKKKREKYFLLAVNLKLLSRQQNRCVKKKKKMVSRKNIR